MWAARAQAFACCVACLSFLQSVPLAPDDDSAATLELAAAQANSSTTKYAPFPLPSPKPVPSPGPGKSKEDPRAAKLKDMVPPCPRDPRLEGRLLKMLEEQKGNITVVNTQAKPYYNHDKWENETDVDVPGFAAAKDGGQSLKEANFLFHTDTKQPVLYEGTHTPYHMLTSTHKDDEVSDMRYQVQRALGQPLPDPERESVLKATTVGYSYARPKDRLEPKQYRDMFEDAMNAATNKNTTKKACSDDHEKAAAVVMKIRKENITNCTQVQGMCDTQPEVSIVCPQTCGKCTDPKPLVVAVEQKLLATNN